MFSPAHSTKHVPLLPCPFRTAAFLLAQRDDGHSNGTALWLGAQCLSLYLATIRRSHSARLVELGSGIGFTALAMSSLGWDVLATDIPHVISSVLAQNIHNNLHRLPPASGKIQVRELDWTVPSDLWTWDSDTVIASASPSPCTSSPDSSSTKPRLTPPFDLICSADTVYTPALVEPLLRTLHALATLSRAASPAARAPPTYLCLERRDPALVDRVLAAARDQWGFAVQRIPHRKLAKALEKGRVRWAKDDWAGVEIWKLTLTRG